MALQRLKAQRVSKAARQRKTVAKPKSTIKALVLPTLITLALGSIFGDFILKRNIEKYIAERKEFVDSPQNAFLEFEEIRKSFNKPLGNRRGQTQRMSKLHQR